MSGYNITNNPPNFKERTIYAQIAPNQELNNLVVNNLTINPTGTFNAPNNVTILGNLSVGGTITSPTISGLQTQITTQAGQISGLQSSVATQAGQISGLQSSVATQAGQISGLQTSVATQAGQISSLSGTVSGLKWNGVNLKDWTAQSNTNYIWNLPDIRSSTGGALVTFPSSPIDGDFIEIVDGLGTWGNTLYGNIGVNTQGKQLIGMTATGTVSLTGVAGGFYDFRKGSVLFTYKSSSNTWYANGTVSVSMGSEYNEVVSTSVDPWSGWWMFSSQTTNQMTNMVAKYGTQRLNQGGANQALSFAYIDATLYPISITFYSNHPSNPSAGGAVYARCFEYLQTGANPDITTLVHINSQVGTQSNVPTTKYWVGGSNTNAQGGSFRLQSDRSVCTVTWDQTIPLFNPSVQNQSAIMKKILALPGYSEKTQVEAAISRFNDDFDIANENNFDDMTILFKQMCLAAIYDSNPQSQQSANGSGRFLYQNDVNYFIGNTGPNGYELGALKAIEVMNDFLSPQGITFTTPITKILKSFTGAAGNIQVPTSGGSTQVTTIFTKGFSYAAPGSNVTISGLNDSWASLNGNYPNGISIWEYTNNRKYSDPYHMDLYQSGSTYTGTLTDVWNRVNLIADTWNPSFQCVETGPYKNFAVYSSTTGAISVTHRVYPTMPYNEFYAAISAFCQYVFGPITHTRVQGKSYCFKTGLNNLGRVAVNWRKLTDTNLYSLVTTNIRFRTGPNDTPAPYYIYATPSTTDLLMRNDPYSVLNTLASLKTTLGVTSSNLPIVPTNYLTGAKDLWVGMDGIQTFNSVSKPYGYTDYTSYSQAGTLLGLRNISYTGYTGGTTFVGRLFPVNSVPTGAGPFDQYPDYRYWLPFYTTAAQTTATGAIANAKSNAYRSTCGMINPQYTTFEGYPGWSGATGARKIGYWIQPSTTIGLGALIYTSPFCPTVNPASVTGPYNQNLATGPFKPFSAGLTNVYSTVMNYLVGELGCDSIIIDNRFNAGGAGAEGIEVSEFFGADRNGTKVFLRRADNGFGSLIDIDNYQWPLDGQNIISQKNSQLNVTTNSINYPNAVFKGVGTSFTGAKKVVMLTSSASLSNGSRFQRNWLGDNGDKKIGGNTIVKFIGSSDSRFQGTSTTAGYAEIPPQFGSDFVSSGNTYLQMNIETPTYGLVAQYIPVGKTGTLWYHKDYPGLTGATSVNQAKNGVTGTNGVGYALPENLQTTLYADWGAYTGAYAEKLVNYSNMYLSSKTADLNTKFGAGNWPVISNYQTWRDSWLETAIYEAMVPVLSGEN
jgi:hypothetical protein